MRRKRRILLLTAVNILSAGAVPLKIRDLLEEIGDQYEVVVLSMTSPKHVANINLNLLPRAVKHFEWVLPAENEDIEIPRWHYKRMINSIQYRGKNYWKRYGKPLLPVKGKRAESQEKMEIASPKLFNFYLRDCAPNFRKKITQLAKRYGPFDLIDINHT